MSLKEQLSRVKKQFGDGALMCMGDSEHVPVEVISTGILSLDQAIGVGGVPRGRVIEFYGEEATGKTSLAMSVVAQAQKNGELCAIVDAEHAIDRSHIVKLGVDPDKLYISQPSCGEEGLEIAEALIKSGEIAVVVVDSVAALVPRSELEGDFGDAQMGLQARLMSQAMRKLTGSVHTSNCCLIMINQVRSQLGIVYGSPITTAGGKALKFYSGLRIQVSKAGTLKDGEEIIGARTRAKIIKCKVAPPGKIAEFDLLYGSGFSRCGDLFDLAKQRGLVEGTGAWVTIYGERLQGRANAIAYLEENKEVADKLEAEIRKTL